MKGFKEKNPKLCWLARQPDSFNSRIALLIPQFNEGQNNKHFRERLKYFHNLTKSLKGQVDVILIDDGSTDGSLTIIQKYVREHPDAFYAVSVTPNMNKVGALYATALAINQEFVILSDFDTDMHDLDLLIDNISFLENNETLMGSYFRMLPFEGRGSLFLFQQLEYSLARSCYKFYKSPGCVPVMPGAGCIYKREILIRIYQQHSGLRSGEDREATLLGLKMDYTACYFEKVLTLTRPPLTFNSLLKQRTRWNLGYIEAFAKENQFYRTEMRKGSVIGIKTIADILRVIFVLVLPLAIVGASAINIWFGPMVLLGSYLSSVFWSVNAMLISPKESVEFRHKRLFALLSYPIIKITLDYITWFGAILEFIRNVRNNRYDYTPSADRVPTTNQQTIATARTPKPTRNNEEVEELT